MKKKFLLIISIIGLILLIIFIFISKSSLNFKLIGESTIEINVGDSYEELGYNVTYLDSNVTDEVKVESNLDVNRLGEYTIKYNIKKFLANKTIKRKIIVKDNTSPVISLNGDSKIKLKIGDKYNESGATATDNYDGNITNNIIISGTVNTEKEGTYQITYKVIDSSGNETSVVRNIDVAKNYNGGYGVIIDGPTYIQGILIVNKKYKLPSSFGGTDEVAANALKKLQEAAKKEGFSMPLVSGYRSYETQKRIYNNYISIWGQEYTDTTSARPGHSEHQTGLAFDVGKLTSSYGETKEGIWLKNNCYKYGFIIRYLKGKENITGYSYEPWHIRYVGVDIATYIMENNLTLEEYLGV